MGVAPSTPAGPGRSATPGNSFSFVFCFVFLAMACFGGALAGGGAGVLWELRVQLKRAEDMYTGEDVETAVAQIIGKELSESESAGVFAAFFARAIGGMDTRSRFECSFRFDALRSNSVPCSVEITNCCVPEEVWTNLTSCVEQGGRDERVLYKVDRPQHCQLEVAVQAELEMLASFRSSWVVRGMLILFVIASLALGFVSLLSSFAWLNALAWLCIAVAATRAVPRGLMLVHTDCGDYKVEERSQQQAPPLAPPLAHIHIPEAPRPCKEKASEESSDCWRGTQ